MKLKLELLSASELGEMVSKKEITACELLDLFLARIKEKNPSLNAFVYLKEEEAKKKAKEMDERISKGEYVGPFAGVPFGLKDFLDSKKGWSNSRGGVKSLISMDNEDSPFTIAMEKLGGIALGKCNAPSYGFRGTCDNLLYGPTRNPFDLERNSGGSSGGSACAVGASLVPIAEGGDAGGSIRIPASWCNCFGFKASVGTIANIHPSDSYSTTHPYCMGGGITKSVLDSAILLQEMAYYDPRDKDSVLLNKNYLEEIQKDISSLRIAYTDDFDLFPVQEEIKKITYSKALSLEKRGAKIERVHFSFKRSLKEYASIWSKNISVDSSKEIQQRWKPNNKDLPEEFLYWNHFASIMKEEDFQEYEDAKKEIEEAFSSIFKDYDLILSPVTACFPVINDKNRNTLGPTSIEGKECDPLIGFALTFLVNFVGYPACSVPLGLHHHLPLGLHMIAPRYQDEVVLRAAKHFEDLNPWRDYYLKTV